MLIDEADTFIGLREDLRGILNSGHYRPNSAVTRIVGDKHEPRRFSTWAPKAIAMIGELPDTLADRAVIVRLKRKLPHQRVEPLRHGMTAHLNIVARKIARWVEDHSDDIRAWNGQAPSELNDRAADSWRPLLSIADIAGGRWPESARTAAIALHRDSDDQSAGTQLLADTRAIFIDHGTDRLTSQRLVQALGTMEGRPWGDWRNGKPMTVNQLARELSPYGIAPATIRLGDQTAKGYTLDRFSDAFARYLPEPSHRHNP